MPDPRDIFSCGGIADDWLGAAVYFSTRRDLGKRSGIGLRSHGCGSTVLKVSAQLRGVYMPLEACRHEILAHAVVV